MRERLLLCQERVNLKNVFCGDSFLTSIQRAIDVVQCAHSAKYKCSFQARSTFSSRGGLDVSPIARIDRAHSDRARSASRGDRPDRPSRFHHFQSSIEFMSAGRATDAIGLDRKFV